MSILVKRCPPFSFERIARRLPARSIRPNWKSAAPSSAITIRVFQQWLRYGNEDDGDGQSGGLTVAAAWKWPAPGISPGGLPGGVAYADEGIELREGGIGLPILVLNPERKPF